MILIRAIYWFAQLLTLLLVLRAILSWFAQNPYSSLGRIYQVLLRLTEPIVSPCRNLLHRLNINTGMLDFSVLVAFFLIEIVSNVLMQLVMMFL